MEIKNIDRIVYGNVCKFEHEKDLFVYGFECKK